MVSSNTWKRYLNIFKYKYKYMWPWGYLYNTYIMYCRQIFVKGKHTRCIISTLVYLWKCRQANTLCLACSSSPSDRRKVDCYMTAEKWLKEPELKPKLNIDVKDRMLEKMWCLACMLYESRVNRSGSFSQSFIDRIRHEKDHRNNLGPGRKDPGMTFTSELQHSVCSSDIS